MATITVTPPSARAEGSRQLPLGEVLHRALVTSLALAIAGLILFVAVGGFSYYTLGIEQRPLSPLHAQFRSSGTIGLKLGILSVSMLAILFLYPIRKHLGWLKRIGRTRRWLNVHVVFGITTPLVVTFHSAFRWYGVAGLAYWTMIAVALSGFAGRYLYAKIPRSLNSVGLTMAELEAQAAALAAELAQNSLFQAEDLAPLLTVPSATEIRSMNLGRTLWNMLWMDLVRPFQVGRLRRRVLAGGAQIRTLGGLVASRNATLESIVSLVRRQSRLRAAMAFLDRTERIFRLWHVVHRPFSISFVALILVHIGVALSVGVLHGH